MNTELICSRPRAGEWMNGRTATALALAAAGLLSGCSHSNSDVPAPSAFTTASNVTLTVAQRQNVHLYQVAASRFHKTIETTGTVDFDNDQATTVLAPVSGPATKL